MDPKKQFPFGSNWSDFIKCVNAERIEEAEASLRRMLNVQNLTDKQFLDIGSGSDLSSLVARRLGAKVHSFDFDPQSVASTSELRDRFFPDDCDWTIEHGSALNQEYLGSLGRFDVVYSWGVLHHTGAMWLGIENAINRVCDGGILYLAMGAVSLGRVLQRVFAG